MSNYGESELAMPGRMKAQMCLDQNDFPDIKDCKVGDEMTLQVKVKVTEIRLNRFDTADRKDHVHGEAEIQSIEKM